MVPDMPLEEMERRKRLSEAAPALLEALEAACQEIRLLSPTYEKARAAIAQAKGKESWASYRNIRATRL